MQRARAQRRRRRQGPSVPLARLRLGAAPGTLRGARGVARARARGGEGALDAALAAVWRRGRSQRGPLAAPGQGRARWRPLAGRLRCTAGLMVANTQRRQPAIGRCRGPRRGAVRGRGVRPKSGLWDSWWTGRWPGAAPQPCSLHDCAAASRPLLRLWRPHSRRQRQGAQPHPARVHATFLRARLYLCILSLSHHAPTPSSPTPLRRCSRWACWRPW
jgi:hypothetical protein